MLNEARGGINSLGPDWDFSERAIALLIAGVKKGEKPTNFQR